MIRIGIYGYGNLGKGVESAIAQNPDLTLVGVFTRRAKETVKTQGAPVYSADEAFEKKDEIDVMIICGGSATDLPVQTPALAKYFNVVDSFDTHAKIPQHMQNVQKSAEEGKTTAIISAGWDPGLFSIARAYSGAILCEGQDYTFWGKGVSQGHSDAIRRIDGVADAKQYTIPVESALSAVRRGENPVLSVADKHERECFVVVKEGADTARIEREIKEMPNYFAEYKTTVHFVTQEDLDRDHAGIPHGGVVIRNGVTGKDKTNKHTIEYGLKLDSNAEFTASVLTACARAAYRMHEEGVYGCKTMLDIPPAYLSSKSREELVKTIL